MSLSCYICALAVADTIVLLSGKFEGYFFTETFMIKISEEKYLTLKSIELAVVGNIVLLPDHTRFRVMII